MPDREKVIAGLEFTKAMITFNPSTGEDIEPGNLNEADKTSYDACVGAIVLLKEQEERLRKLQKDKDKLCLEVSEWKHKFHDRPEQDKENGHWIVLEYCANEGIYCSKCLNKIFDRSTKPKKKLSNYCPNCGSKNTHFFNPSTDKIMYSD